MRRRSEHGWTLVETLLALSLIAVGVMGVLAAMSQTLQSAGVTSDTDLALRAIQAKIAEMRAYVPPAGTTWGTGFYNTYNASTVTGATFAPISGLRAPSTGGSGGSLAVAFLTEQQAEQALASGLNFLDLNGNGTPGDTIAPAAGWNAYAAQVTLTWGDQSAQSDRSVGLVTVIYNTGN